MSIKVLHSSVAKWKQIYASLEQMGWTKEWWDFTNKSFVNIQPTYAFPYLYYKSPTRNIYFKRGSFYSANCDTLTRPFLISQFPGHWEIDESSGIMYLIGSDGNKYMAVDFT